MAPLARGQNYNFNISSLVMATHAERSQGVTKEDLSKVWRISVDEAAKTLEQMTQDRVHTADPKIAKKYGTNDRMLCYNKLKEYFDME